MVNPSPLTAPRTPLLRSLYNHILAYFLRWHVTRRMTAFRKSYPQFWAPFAPTLTKSYPILPRLVHRVFLPPSHRPGEAYPLFVLIHGGGWVFGSADMDDEQAALLARAGYLVVSAEYPLAPRHRYPKAILDLEKVVHCVLADGELPIARGGGEEKVVIGGFSAGGVMALALAQLPSLRDKVGAVVSFFPKTDFAAEQDGRRREFRTTAWGEEDTLKKVLGLFKWAYVPAGQDLRDPLLSPIYATRESLKAKVCVVTAEIDCLAEEAEEMARRLAGRGEGADWREGWEEGGVKYICGKGMPHTYTHFWVRPAGEWAERKKVVVKETWDGVLGWLDVVVKGDGGGKGKL